MSRKIPNSLSVGVAALFYVFALLTRMPLHTVASHTGAAFWVLVGAIALFQTRILDGGTGKLIVAIVLWIGLDAGLAFIVVAFGLLVLTFGMLGVWSRLARSQQATTLPFIPYAIAALILVAGLGLLPPELHL